MTGTEKQTVLARVRELAGNLLSALESGDHDAAAGLAEAIQTVGIQSLDRLMPRGTLEFPAGNRWGDSLTGKLLEHLGHTLPEAVTAELLAVLGYWAGEEAVPAIHQPLVKRALHPSVETARTVRSGLHALQMIGGSRAVQALVHLQSPEFPDEVRSQAAWFLNELGGRMVDPMFGSERAPESAEEVRRRDSLEDPYRWRPAAERLRDYLVWVGQQCLEEYPDAPGGVLPPEEAEAVHAAFRDSPFAAMREGALVIALEPVVPRFLIRLTPFEVLALDPVASFFPSSDTEGHIELRVPRDWLRVGLLPESMSASHLDQLPLLDRSDRGAADDVDVRGLIRDWLSVPLHLARLFGRRKQLPLVFSMAALTFRMHRELEFAREVPFGEIVRSMCRGVLNARSSV